MVNKKPLVVCATVTIVAIILLSTTATATMTVTTDSNYVGDEENEPQAVEIEYAISPDDNAATDVRVVVRNTGSSFIDHDSYDRSVSPGDADISINSVGEGVFEIGRIEPDERVTFSFDAYPREVKTNSLEVATISVEYVQEGQNLSNSETVSADLSGFPPDDDSGGGAGAIAFVFGVLLGAAGGAGAAWHVMK